MEELLFRAHDGEVRDTHKAYRVIKARLADILTNLGTPTLDDLHSVPMSLSALSCVADLGSSIRERTRRELVDLAEQREARITEHKQWLAEQSELERQLLAGIADLEETARDLLPDEREGVERSQPD